PERLPEHHVRQQERQAALGQSEEVPAGFQGSRRLARKEGELADVHVKNLGDPHKKTGALFCL
ncbi:hypothetical protein, partial [Pseudomonas gingeri]|uniref:hypothetical protein n=1 Tax=Pseudomonas gingeri TaxID=117681 RepID=UPI001C4323F1